MLPAFVERFLSRDYRVYNRSLRITREGWFFTGFSFAVGIAAINTGNNLMYLMLGMMLSVMAVSGVLSENTLKGLRIERRLPDEVFARSPFDIAYVVYNSKSFFPSYSIRVAEKGVRALVEPYKVKLKARERIVLTGQYIVERRGMLVLREVDVITRFPFGLFEKRKLVDLKESIVVFPSLRFSEDPSKTGAEKGLDENVAIKGEGMSLFGLREYVDGDNPRKISWKVTARTGKIMVKETEAQDMPMIALVLDSSGYRPSDEDFLEEAIRTVAGSAQTLMNKGYLVRLITAEEDVPYGAGAHHLNRILTSLALFEPTPGKYPNASLRPGEARVVIKGFGGGGSASVAPNAAA